MGAGGADIAGIIPEIAEKLPDLHQPPPLSPEESRFRLFESITSFLRSASQKTPLVVILDNIHWSDEPSLLLLEFLVPELSASRILVVAIYRDTELTRRHPLSRTLGELTRDRLHQRVLLKGLSHEDVGRLIELAVGIEPPPGLVDAVYTQTEGNPRFTTEVVRLLVEEGGISLEQDKGGNQAEPGDIRSESWTVRIPEGVRTVVGKRLDRLSDRCNEVLTVAAVVGREFWSGSIRRNRR